MRQKQRNILNVDISLLVNFGCIIKSRPAYLFGENAIKLDFKVM